MKKIAILVGVMLIGLTLFGQKEYDKYPNIDSLKPILKNTLFEFFIKDDMSFLDSDIQVNDSLMYSHYNPSDGYYEYLNTMESKEYIKTVLDPNLSNFINHPDYEVKILENGVDGFINAQSKWVIIVMISSEKYDNQLVVEFNFHHSNKLQYVDIVL